MSGFVGMGVPRRVTEFGPERYCRACDEWWFDDSQFFGTTIDRDGNAHVWCRACKASRRAEWERQRRKRAA